MQIAMVTLFCYNVSLLMLRSVDASELVDHSLLFENQLMLSLSRNYPSRYYSHSLRPGMAIIYVVS